MGFTYIELMQALDGVVKKQYLEAVPNGHRLADPGNADLLFAGQVLGIPPPPAAPP